MGDIIEISARLTGKFDPVEALKRRAAAAKTIPGAGVEPAPEEAESAENATSTEPRETG